MSNRLKRLINMIKPYLPGTTADPETAEVVAELLDSAETLPEVEYLATESGMGEIPDELLNSSGFYEITGHKPEIKEPVTAPVTGVVARARRSKKRTTRRSRRASDMDHPTVRKPRRQAG